MVAMRVVLFTLQALAVAVYALPTNSLPARAAAVTDPSQDAFYQPPSGFETKAPGTILRSRQITAAFFGLIFNPVQAYQLLYRTTAANGSAIATVTTVFKPLIAHNDRFVSFQTAYDSSAAKCNPSFNYQLGAPQDSLISSVELLLIQTYLSSGYIVSSSDYEGPDAAFGAGRLSGTGVLDSIRAVGNFKSTLGLSTSTPAVVGAGYSGGAIATGWAAALHPSYAPELKVKGWVAGGTPANLTSVTTFVDNTLFSGFLPAAIVGLAKPSAYGADLQPLLNSIVTTRGREVLDFASENCAVADIANFLRQSILSTDVQSLGANLLYNPVISSVLSKQTLGVVKTETPTVPVLLYHATSDEIIPYTDAAKLYSSWCANGANVKFTEFASGGHATTEVIGLPDALTFVQQAFAGTVASGCSKTTKLDSDLNPLALGLDLEPILTKLVDALLDAGEKDANIKADVKVLNKTVT